MVEGATLKYSEEEIESLKNDPVFLDSLQKRETEALEEQNILKLYDVLDTYLLLEKGSDEQINRLYENILELALDKLSYKLQSRETCSLDNDEEHITLRAIYEYAIEHYSSGKLHEASELFLMLSILTENRTFIGAMQIHLVATLKNISFDDFLDEFVDIDMMDEQNESFFMLYFRDSANRFLHENSQLITDAVKEMKTVKL
jgi:hypothetical protein